MKKTCISVALLFLSPIFLGLILTALGFRLNLSESIPIGLYRITNKAAVKKAYVIFCPNNRQTFKLARNRGYIDHGICSHSFGYLMKKVVAIAGDVVSVTNEGVFINNRLLPHSKPKLCDGLNRDLPQWRVSHYQLQQGEVMTMTNQSDWSFDSRYYGPIRTSQIKGVITPIWIKTTLEKKYDHAS